MRLVIAVGVALVLAAHARADCGPPRPPAEEFERASAVFAGRVVDAVPHGGGYIYHFEVDVAWKGVTGRRVTVTNESIGCGLGYGFQVGRPYLVYAYATPAGLSAGSCGNTASLEIPAANLLGPRPRRTFAPEVPPESPPAPAPARFPWPLAVAFALGAAAATLVARWRRARAVEACPPATSPASPPAP